MWVEAELRRELQQVRAPEELWERVQRPRAAVSRGGRGYVWVLAAAAMVMVVLFLARPRGEFRSGDAARIRAWVLLHAGLDVPLQASTALRLVGAKGTDGRAEIACRVGDRDVKLTVSRARAGVVEVSAHQAYKGGKAVSWAMRGQLYTLACATPEDLQVACMLCHAGGVRPVG
ncbi:MAG TPA: hypothetical protein VEU96_14040 [Bryobacteraceae bacterium]|nr:hypothetical protein [Bryobacteraceae bacterium]